MKTKLKFILIGERFEYKRTIFEKISPGKVKCIYKSLLFKEGQEIPLPINTQVSHIKRKEVIKPVSVLSPQLWLFPLWLSQFNK